MTTISKTARDLAGWNTDLARQIDAALEDRYRRGYERGWKAALARLHGVLAKLPGCTSDVEPVDYEKEASDG